MSRFLLLVAIAASVFSASTRAENHASEDAVQRGRYITKIGGCNDCHTPGFAQSAGKIPESQWLTGDALGFSGPREEGLLADCGLERDRRRNVSATEIDYRASRDKIFTAGDMRRGQSLVVWAIREGRQAARAIDMALMGTTTLPT